MNLKTKLLLLAIALLNISLYAQDSFQLKGTVSDANNVPIPGANIVIANSTKGTSTDFDGNYEITVKKGDVLNFSYIGYVNQQVVIVNQKTVNITLTEDASQLDEVVVVGYGTQKKSHLSGAVSKVTNESLDQIATARADDALVGQVSGVNIQATNPEAGEAPTIRIRGVGSINASSNPLLVVLFLILNFLEI